MTIQRNAAQEIILMKKGSFQRKFESAVGGSLHENESSGTMEHIPVIRNKDVKEVLQDK